MRKKISNFLFLLAAFAVIIYSNWHSRDGIEAFLHDLRYDNPYVRNTSEVYQVLNQFELITISDLPNDYKLASKMADSDYTDLMSGMKFYKLTKEDCYQKIVGDFRIKEFVAKDANYRSASSWNNHTIYWGINPQILLKLMELKSICEERNLNWNSLSINSGHRTPLRNEQVGGASKSRHMVGEAVDLTVGDFNNDGVYTEADKDLLLKICDEELIKDQGGIGKYPGTRNVHIDVRGYRARWNTY